MVMKTKLILRVYLVFMQDCQGKYLKKPHLVLKSYNRSLLASALSAEEKDRL